MPPGSGDYLHELRQRVALAQDYSWRAAERARGLWTKTERMRRIPPTHIKI